jgi:hypothetical protein
LDRASGVPEGKINKVLVKMDRASGAPEGKTKKFLGFQKRSMGIGQIFTPVPFLLLQQNCTSSNDLPIIPTANPY